MERREGSREGLRDFNDTCTARLMPPVTVVVHTPLDISLKVNDVYVCKLFLSKYYV